MATLGKASLTSQRWETASEFEPSASAKRLLTIGPVFVVGAPRSGTTVFSLKLAESAGIAMAPETHFMAEVWSPLRHLDLNDNASLDVVLGRFSGGRWFADLGLTTESIRQEFLGLTNRSWPNLFDTILGLYAASRSRPYRGEKTPGHYRYVDELLAWYPSCRVVFLVRDPRSVVASSLRAPFSPSYSWFVARRWRELADTHRECVNDSRVSHVRYEDFVAAPTATLEATTERLGLTVADSPESSGDTFVVAPRKSGWRAQHLHSAESAVNVNGLDRWRNELSDRDIWITDRYTASELHRYSYQTANSDGYRVAHWLGYCASYPLQRLRLAVLWAVNTRQQLAGNATSKARLFGAAGYLLDQLSYLRFKLVAAFSSPLAGSRFRTRRGRPLAVITPGSQASLQSSFLPLPADDEVLGLFAVALSDLGYDLCFAANSREQYFTVLRIAFSFGLEQRVRFVTGGHACQADSPTVEVFGDQAERPSLYRERLSIDALNAASHAQSVDRTLRTRTAAGDCPS